MKILIVDDDKIFIRKVIERVNWDDIGIHRVFSAEDMQQACKVLETFSIDIVVTDVEMARGNGLELLSWIAENKYSVETLVVSGYAHFAYAQKAMEYGCKRYLLKPVSGRELSVVLENIVKQRKQKLPENKRSISCEWKEIINGSVSEAPFTYELQEKSKLYSHGERFSTVLLRIFSEQGRGETEERLLQVVVRNVILEFAEESSFDIECIKQGSDEQWILLLRIYKGTELMVQELRQIQNYLEETMHLISCFFIGNGGIMDEMLSGYDNFCHFCDEAIFEEQGVVYQSDWQLSEDVHIESPCFEELETMLISGENSQVKRELENHIQLLVEAHKATRTIFRSFQENMTQMMHSFLQKNNLSFQQLYEKEQYDIACSMAETSVSGMENFIRYLLEKLDDVGEINDRKKQIVELLKTYISEHISEELTRKMLAQSIHFSEDYVARVFKAETGKSISTYVMEQRMKLAKKYLLETNMSISDVAIMVGYNNFSYFSKTFKDYTGKTPNEYRICEKSAKF